MRAFSQLLDDLVYTRSRNTKLKLIGDYLKETPDPDRGYGLAALTGTLDIPAVKPAAVRAIGRRADRPGAVLHEPRLCRRHGRDGVAAVAEAAPASRRKSTTRRSASPTRSTGCARPRSWRRRACLRRCSTISMRRAATRCSSSRLGELRVGINARLAKQALADAFGLEVEAVEEVWHGLRPPFAELFDWAEGRAEQPTARDVPVFRPFMLAHPLDETKVSLDDYAAEWKWDGIRVQLVHAGGETRLYSRTGDDISGSFPDVAEAFRTRGVLDGELLVRGSRPGRCRRARRRGGELQRAPAAARAQERQPEDARRLSRLRAALRHIVRGRRGSARAAVGASAARGSRALRQRSTRERFDVSQLIEARELRAARGPARSMLATWRSKGSCSSAATAPMSPGAAPACGTNGSAIR